MTPRARRIGTAVVAVAALAVGVAIGALAGRSAGDEGTTPANNSPEAGFVRDMSTHHAQAVSMADAIRTRTQDPNLALLATDIVLTQQSQIGRFSGWLDQWGLPLTSVEPPMSWVPQHSEMDMSTMPGMATNDEIRQLESLPVGDAEVMFLTLMIRHHQGGVEMADAILMITTRDDVRRMASSIVASQQSEIEAMQAMLDERTTT